MRTGKPDSLDSIPTAAGPRVLDLFSGAGGIALGFADVGYQIVGGIDNFQPAVDSFKANIPGARGMARDLRVRDFSDVREFIGSAGVDVIVGGTSCHGNIFLLGARQYNTETAAIKAWNTRPENV